VQQEAWSNNKEEEWKEEVFYNRSRSEVMTFKNEEGRREEGDKGTCKDDT
jgi:hypothetical protein